MNREIQPHKMSINTKAITKLIAFPHLHRRDFLNVLLVFFVHQTVQFLLHLIDRVWILVLRINEQQQQQQQQHVVGLNILHCLPVCLHGRHSSQVEQGRKSWSWKFPFLRASLAGQSCSIVSPDSYCRHTRLFRQIQCFEYQIPSKIITSSDLMTSSSAMAAPDCSSMTSFSSKAHFSCCRPATLSTRA